MTLWPRTVTSAQSDYKRSLFLNDKAKAEQIAGKITSIEVLAPLAPVALSPFFGITCLSGTSILCSRGVLPENDFLMGNRALNNGLVFLVFLALSAATSLPKMTTVSKGFAEAADQLETYAGIISYLVIFYLAGAAPQSQTSPAIYTAGIITLTKDTLLAAAVVINVIVIHTVKYFFELLVWITPIPALDALFETTNKIVTAALVAIYAFNPYLAMLINLILFLMCLAIFNRVRRKLKYFKAVLIEPIIAKLFGKAPPIPTPRVKAKIAAVIQNPQPLIKVFPAKKIRKIKKNELSYLTPAADGLFLVKLRLIRAPKTEKLPTQNTQFDITAGLISNSIQISAPDIKKPIRLSFSKIYNSRFDDIAAALKPFGSVHTQPPSTAQTPAPKPHLA